MLATFTAGVVALGTAQTGHTGTYASLQSLSPVQYGGTTSTSSYSLTVAQGILCGGNVDVWSDRRAKQDIVRLDPADSLAKLLAVPAVSYVWNDGRDDRSPQLGFIAQDVGEAGIGNAVKTAEVTLPDGTTLPDFHTLDKHQLVAVLWAAVQGLAEEVRALKA